MRDLIVTENITLDGVVEASDDWFLVYDAGADTSDLLEVSRQHSAAADAFLVGRETFESMRGFWPEQTDDKTGITQYLNEVQKYVVSSTLQDPGWEPTTVLRGCDEVAGVKEQPGKDITVTGSIGLVQELAERKLVDEYRLFVYPVTAGHGRRLFEDGRELRRFALVETRAFSPGVVLLRYRTK
ncbi:dihydrofolate reductase family protein [Kribbella italica]|uniref:Dihydrofolate reductase n=1 Tax=Kribbella italica TaxID=1540520 RepID=A0A7W9J802_9ACTN|nr:dihydrofolate reductase family protein [Kribbella italica]MBB5837321.1 dihydrofolate reductase [Kribbella italica]